MLKSEIKREVYDFFVCDKNTLEIIYRKDTTLMSFENAENTCNNLNEKIGVDLIVCFDLASNRKNNI